MAPFEEELTGEAGKDVVTERHAADRSQPVLHGHQDTVADE
jgi:hypothetical protein